jgi:Zn-dependent M32 family carboxypeptidase
MKTIKLTKKQLQIIRHALEEYKQFLYSIDEEQMNEELKRFGRNLDDNLKRLDKKLCGKNKYASKIQIN